MKKPLLIFALACFVALSSIICGSLCGREGSEPMSASSEAAC